MNKKEKKEKKAEKALLTRHEKGRTDARIVLHYIMTLRYKRANVTEILCLCWWCQTQSGLQREVNKRSERGLILNRCFFGPD